MRNVGQRYKLKEITSLKVGLKVGESRKVEYRETNLVWEVFNRSHNILYAVNPSTNVSREVLGNEPCCSRGFIVRVPDT